MLKLHSSPWIVIVNYRTAELAINCLNSLAVQRAELANMHAIVVDNNSSDGSVEKLISAVNREGWSSWAEIMPLDINGGFAYGNNTSIRIALNSPEPPDYILLLNPDTVALPGAVKSLVDFMETHPNAGIAGSQLRDSNGQVDISAHRFPSPLSELVSASRLGILSRLLPLYVVTPPPQNSAHPCDWISGASMIIRREVLEDIGLMDDSYFLYFEEVDFCRRAHQAGWECWHVPDSQVMHLEGASTGIRTKTQRRAAYWFDSRRRFFIKHYGIAGLLAADVFWCIGRLSYLFRSFLHLGTKGNASYDPKWFMFDLLWGDLKSILLGRAWSISHTGKQS